MADIMAATGLKKGGIYNHFASKDDLAIAAFDYSVQKAGQLHLRAIRRARHSPAQLQAMVHSFVAHFDEICAWGGCPLMNTLLDSDDGHPQLQARVRMAMDQWRCLIKKIVQRGIDRGELAPPTNPDAVATIVIAVLEGALALARLYSDRVHLDDAKAHLDAYIHSLTAADDTS